MTNRILGGVFLACTILLSPNLPAQTSSPSQHVSRSPYADVNDAAVLSRSANVPATNQLSRALFTSVGVPSELTEALGYTNRISSAEVAYRHGNHAAVHEADVTRSVNNLMSTLGAPTWAHTTDAEVRKLRMHMLVLYPQMMVSEKGIDSQGKQEAVSSGLRPMEAAYLATTMLYQKAYNGEYQFSDAEKAENKKLSAQAVAAKQAERTQSIVDLVHGKTQTASVTDLLAAADRMFTDLNIPSSDVSATHIPSGLVTHENGSGQAPAIIVVALGVCGAFGFRKRLRPGMLLLILGCVCTLAIGLSGCGSGSPSAPYNVITTEVTVNGVTQAWPNASLNGYAVPGEYNCGSNSCVTQFAGTTNSSTAQYDLESWAIPGGWEISAAADSTCARGTSTGDITLNASGSTTLVCGLTNAANITPSLNSCYKQINTSNNAVTTNCPLDITLSANVATFPTAYAMSVGSYSDTGASSGSAASITAGSTTSASIGTPGFNATGVSGVNIVVLRDSVSNGVLGATSFIYTLSFYSGTGPR
jgi:hypothetical protein